MTGKADRRRPLLVAGALVAVIGAALVVPVLIGARQGEPIPGSTVRAETRDSIAITTPVTLFSAPAVTLNRGTVSLLASSAEESGVGAVVRALVLGSGVDLALDGARFTVDRSGAAGEAAQGVPADLSEALGSVVSALAGFKFRSLDVSDATVVVRAAEGGREVFSRIDAHLATDRSGLVTAKGRLAYRGERLDFDVSFTPPPADADQPVDVRASVKGAYLTLAFNGRMAPGDRGRIMAENAELSISDVRAAASWLGTAWPAGPGLGPFAAKGQLTLDERSIAFEHAKFTLDGNAATGALAVTFGAERPSIEGTLAFATFDLTPYAEPQRPSAIALATGWLSGIGIPGLAEPSLLAEVDADLRISAASVTHGSAKLGRSAASLSVKGGKLYGEIAELALEQGGTGEGQFTVDMTGPEPRYTLRADLAGIDFATLARPGAGPAVVDGVGTIKLDLTAEGATEAEFVRSLAGTLAVELREGGRVGIDIDALPQAAAPPAEGWGPAGAGTTAVSTLAAHFTALGGVLTANGVEAQTGDRTARVIGSVDIDSAAVDLVLSIDRIPGAAEAKTDKPVGAFKIQGPWAQPSISPAAPGRAARGGRASGLDPG